MRSLREKLMAVTSRPAPSEKKQTVFSEPFYVRERRVPLEALHGFAQTKLDELISCDPAFTGKHWDIRSVLFLDTETTGLSGGTGTLAFEIGVGFVLGTDLHIRQYVMRDYSEEAAMLSDIAALLQQYETLVTFNGKTFDIPLLESRMILHRLRPQITSMPHLDLLHVCRRVFKLRLKRCNLSSLEEAILGEIRSDDLPGALVPQRYFDYLNTREFALLEDVLRHNLRDVQSLASLIGYICALYRNPEQISHAEDLFSVGRTFERSGNIRQARRCYRILGHSTMSSQAHMRLADSYKREKEWQEALVSWQIMISRGEGGSHPYIECAKYYEHSAHDPRTALRYAQNALSHELNVSLLNGVHEDQLSAIHKRIDRLKRKCSILNNR